MLMSMSCMKTAISTTPSASQRRGSSCSAVAAAAVPVGRMLISWAPSSVRSAGRCTQRGCGRPASCARARQLVHHGREGKKPLRTTVGLVMSAITLSRRRHVDSRQVATIDPPRTRHCHKTRPLLATRRLLHDPVERVAGALVVLYAQPVARIARLTRADLTRDGEQTLLRLRRDQLLLPSRWPASPASSPATVPSA